MNDPDRRDPRPIPPDIAYYNSHPERYAKTAALIDLAIEHGGKPCVGEPCDLDSPCKRHRRSGDVASRLYRRRTRQRPKPAL